jgi:hypothetical protein
MTEANLPIEIQAMADRGVRVHPTIWAERCTNAIAALRGSADPEDKRRIRGIRAALEPIAVQADSGRVRARWRRIDSGRYHSFHPNLQGITGKHGVRDAILPEEGCAFVDVDWSSCHLWFAAGLAGDERLIAELREGTVYEHLGALLAPELAGETARRAAKIAILAALNGGRGRPLQTKLAELGIPIELSEARARTTALMDRYPAVAGLVSSPPSSWVLPLSGRRVEGPAGFERASWLWQSHEAEALVRAMGLCRYPVALALHDGMLVEVPLGELEPGARHVAEIMDQALEAVAGIDLRGASTVKVSIRPSWGGAAPPPAAAPGVNRDPVDLGPEPPPVEDEITLDGRPEILLGPELHRNVAAALAALADRADLYVRNGEVVRVAEGRILEISAPALQVHLSESVAFVRLRPTEDGPRYTRVEPPLPLARSILGLGTYPGLRELVGITRIPELRPDGSISAEPGYDAGTRLVYAPERPPPKVPERPNRDDARQAALLLLSVVEEFPFLSDADRSVWLALVLTLACRSAIQGAVPFFLITANQARVGKTSVGELAATCAGVTTAPSRWPEGQHGHEELGKRIDGWIHDGSPVGFLDNVRGQIAGTALEAAITSYPLFQLRALGGSEMQLVPQRTTFLATGNGASVAGDVGGRVLPLRLYHAKPQPELRSFSRTNLRAWVAERQSELHAAALTIVSAYLQAECPDAPTKLWGSFEAWTTVVCGAIGWCELPDPRDTRASLERIDQSGGLHDRLIACIGSTMGVEWTAGDLADKLAAEGARPDHDVGGGWHARDTRQLAAELNVWESGSKTVNRRALGELVGRILDRPSLDGRRIAYRLDPTTGERRKHRTKVPIYTLESA